MRANERRTISIGRYVTYNPNFNEAGEPIVVDPADDVGYLVGKVLSINRQDKTLKISYLCTGSSYRVKSGMSRKLAYAAKWRQFTGNGQKTFDITRSQVFEVFDSLLKRGQIPKQFVDLTITEIEGGVGGDIDTGVSGREDEADQDSHEDIVAVDLGEADRAAALAELGGDYSDDEEEKDTPVNAALKRAKDKERNVARSPTVQ